MFTSKKILDITELTKFRPKQSYDTIILTLPLYKKDVIRPYSDIVSNSSTAKNLVALVSTANKYLKDGGALYIYGSPVQLVRAYQELPKNLRFRHWIALDMLDSFEKATSKTLQHSHAGILMLIKGKGFPKLDTKNTRVPYWVCGA